ncbi:MAG: cytochrome c [Phycisphaeraceae bacterium]|nr:cytochrome c [Phycisphaeraceae bacterium]MCB9847447.1 cytochrome c [Phycisphaeraceae bacterium]
MTRPDINNPAGKRLALAGACALACLVAMPMAGCRGDRTAKRPRQFFPDMDDSPKYKAQSESPVYADGRAMRQPVAGVVAWGSSTDANDPDRRWVFQDNDAVMLGINPDGSYVEVMPIRDILGLAANDRLSAADVESFIQHGKEQYSIFCYPCHGAAGDGKGIVGNLWSTPLPSYHDARFQRGGANGQDGYIFHTIRNGLPNAPGALPALKMPSYADRVSEQNAWSIVAYIRALQKTQQGELRDVPESRQDALIATKGAALRSSAEPKNEEPAQ